MAELTVTVVFVPVIRSHSIPPDSCVHNLKYSFMLFCGLFQAQESDSEESRMIHKKDDEDEITEDSEWCFITDKNNKPFLLQNLQLA